MNYFRTNFQTATFPPKMHMLEEHTVPFMSKWKFPVGRASLESRAASPFT